MKEFEHNKLPLFYLTPPAPCPYLEGRVERKMFTHLSGSNANALNDTLTHAGFRRSQNILYKHACEECRACISVRVKAREFAFSKGFKRVLKKNSDLCGTHLRPETNKEQFELLSKYLDQRHKDGGMADMGVFDYMGMVEDTCVDTHLVEYHDAEGVLVAVCLIDRLSDGLSMVYSFYDPERDSRSLGTFMILDQIQRTLAAGLDYLYLGYWIEGCGKMVYKQRFKPLEQLTEVGWEPF
ncbi:MAG: arginyltransferase [Parvibaculales bacterium]